MRKKNLLIYLALGGVAYYLWQKSQAPAVVIPAPAPTPSPLGV